MTANTQLLGGSRSYGSTDISSLLRQSGIEYTVDRTENIGELHDDLSIVKAVSERFAKFILGKDTGEFLEYPPRNYLSEFKKKEIKILRSLLGNRSCSCSSTQFSKEQIQLIYDTIMDQNKRFVGPVLNEMNQTEDGRRTLVAAKATFSFNNQNQIILQISEQAIGALTRYLDQLNNTPTRTECLRDVCLFPIALCCAHPVATCVVTFAALVVIGEVTGFWWTVQGMEPPK